MAKINKIIDTLGENNFFIVKQTQSFDGGEFSESDKVCIGKYDGSEIKDMYIKMYRDATIDGLKPTIKAFEGMYNRISQWGLKVSSTEVTYWFLKDTADWMEIYSGEPTGDNTITQSDLDNISIVPSKGYEIVWDESKKVWSVSGYDKDGDPVFIGYTKYAKAIDLSYRVWNKKGWHCNVVRIDLDEQPLPDSAVEITNGVHRKLRVMSTEYGIFTSMGETYAQGSFSTTHKS